MKNLQSIINQKPVYLNDWQKSKKKGLMADFEIDHIEGNILFAFYGLQGYEGDAFVLFAKGGKLYEVNAWHCSCFGLEGQFTPEETTLEALAYRLTNGEMGKDLYEGNYYCNELKQFLGIE